MAPVNLLSKGYIGSHLLRSDVKVDQNNEDEMQTKSNTKNGMDSDSDVEIVITNGTLDKGSMAEKRQTHKEKQHVDTKIATKLREVAKFNLELKF